MHWFKGRSRWSVCSGVLHFDGQSVKVRLAHVLEAMWRKGHSPASSAKAGRVAGQSSVEEHNPVGIPAYEVATPEDVEDAGPPMCVHRDYLARLDPSVQHSNPLVLKQDGVEFGCSNDGVRNSRARAT